jgi:hypothetical protein
MAMHAGATMHTALTGATLARATLTGAALTGAAIAGTTVRARRGAFHLRRATGGRLGRLGHGKASAPQHDQTNAEHQDLLHGLPFHSCGRRCGNPALTTIQLLAANERAVPEEVVSNCFEISTTFVTPKTHTENRVLFLERIMP